MTIGPIGRLFNRQTLEQTIITIIRSELGVYLDEVVSQTPLGSAVLPRPQADDSYYGGVDEESWREDQLPVIVVRAVPTDTGYRSGSGEYHRWYEIAITPIVGAGDEDTARAFADHYATAITGLISQSENLGGIASDLMLHTPGDPEFADAEDRVFAQTNVTFEALVCSIVDESLSPKAFERAEVTDFTLNVVPDDQPVS